MPRLLRICKLLSLIPAYVYLNMYTHNPAHMSIFLDCYTYTHLPPSSPSLMLAPNIHTYLNSYFCPFYRDLFFTYVFSYVYVYVYTCSRMYVRVYLWIPCILFVFVSCVYSFFPTGLYICVWRPASCVFCFICITTFVFQKNEYIYWICTHVTVPIAVHIALPMFIYSLSCYLSLCVNNVCVHSALRIYLPAHVHWGSPQILPPYLHSHVYTFTLAWTSISRSAHTPIPLYPWVFIFLNSFVYIRLFLQQSVPSPNT